MNGMKLCCVLFRIFSAYNQYHLQPILCNPFPAGLLGENEGIKSDYCQLLSITFCYK